MPATMCRPTWWATAIRSPRIAPTPASLPAPPGARCWRCSRGSGLGDVAVVVTRYFRRHAAGHRRAGARLFRCGAAGAGEPPRAEKVLAHTVMAGFGYPYVERMRRLVAAHHGQVLDEDFAAEVTLTARFRGGAPGAFQRR